MNQACPNYPPTSEVPYKKGLSTDVLLIVDQPTLTDTYIKELLAGEPGEYLQYVFDKTGIKKGAFWIASAARCHFDKQSLSVKQVNSILKCCGEKLHKLIKLIKPKLVIATGELAAKQFGKSVGGVKRNRGLVKSVGEDYPAVLITYSPSYCVVNPSYQVEFERDIALAKSYIDNGFELNVIEPVVEQVEDLESVLPDNLQTIAIDTETQGLDWLDPNSLLISFSICFNRSHAYQVVLQQWADNVSQADYFITTTQKEYRTKVETCIPIKRAVNYEKNLKLLRDLIENPNIKKYMFNGQFDLCFIARECEKTLNHKLQIKNFAMDVQALAHALDENLFSRASLESVRKRFSNFNSQYSVTFDTNFDKNNVILIPKDELCSYAALDAYTTFISGLGAKEALLSETKSLQNYFIRFVMPTLSYALPTLTMNGGYIDKAAIPSVKDEVAQLIQKTHKEAIDLIPYRIKKDLAPHMLRLSRNALVRDTLFHKDGFNIKATNPTKGGVLPSVGSEARTYLKGAKIPENAAQFIEKYEQWSMLNVLLTRYIKAFETSIRSDGRIHPTYAVVTTSTGRTSTVSPSFQNLPKRSESAKMIRRLIVPEQGNVLLALDYSQNELRWMAHLSQDETMRQVYREDGDIHTKTALAILGKPREEVSDAELKPARRSAKCFHPDTEVLTKEGWVSFKNLKPNIEVMQAVKNGTSIDLEWSKPLYFKLEPNHTDSLVSIRSENINLKVTPDHQMLVQRQNGNFDKVSIDSFVKARSFWNAGYYSSSNCSNLEERIIRLAVATQADGSYFPHGIRFGFYKTRKVERLLGLLENGEYNIAEHKNGKNRPVTAITLKGPIVDNIKSLLNLDKTFNWNMLNWSLSDRLIVIDELKYWDSFYHKNGKFINYSSTAKINCDVIQALCAISGWKTKLRVDVSDRYSTGCIYNLHLKDSPKSRGLSSGKLASYELNSEPYTGDVAVISMPSDIILVRSHEGDGRQIPLICHQCMNFGLLYGMSTMGFQRYSKISYDIDLTFDEAASFINLFFSTYPGIQKYHRSVINFARKNGYVQSPFGRKRRLPGINSNMPGEAARCERQALNHAIQSAASDMALIALNEILKSGILDPKEAKPIMFVHDELVFEIKETRLDYYAPLIQYQMENPPLKKLFGVEFAIPIKTDAQIGYNYADLSSYTAKDEDNK